MSDAVTRLNAALKGRYAIEHELGEGGMATVYLAEDLKHHRNVALKVLKPELAVVVGAERFLAEIEVTAKLQHPNILPLFDSGEADAFLFYVMPYVEGDTLKDRLDREHQLPVSEAVHIATDVAEALDYAHRQGVIHRDIKPANVLMLEGKPVVSDFGIALAVGAAGGGRLTETGLSLGTPHYMSPEQATGDQAVGASTDTYALGSVLYEMLVGEPPYPGTTAQAVLGKIIAGELVSAAKHRPSVPPNVDAAVRCALEKLPADRFTGVQDFVRALADPGFRYGEPAGAAAGEGAGSWKTWSMALAAVALVSTLGFGWSLLRSDTPPPVVRFELNVPDGLGLFGGNLSLTISPDGSRVVFVGISAAGGRQLWLRPLDQLAPVPIAGTEGGRNPRFSPDGESIAFTGGGSLTTVSLSGAPPLTLVSGAVANSGLAWGPDGRLYFRYAGRGRLWRVSANGGESESVTGLEPGEEANSGRTCCPTARGSSSRETSEHPPRTRSRSCRSRPDGSPRCSRAPWRGTPTRATSSIHRERGRSSRPPSTSTGSRSRVRAGLSWRGSWSTMARPVTSRSRRRGVGVPARRRGRGGIYTHLGGSRRLRGGSGSYVGRGVRSASRVSRRAQSSNAKLGGGKRRVANLDLRSRSGDVFPTDFRGDEHEAVLEPRWC